MLSEVSTGTNSTGKGGCRPGLERAVPIRNLRAVNKL